MGWGTKPNTIGEKVALGFTLFNPTALLETAVGKLQHWRGFRSIFGLEGSPVLEFGFSTEHRRHRRRATFADGV